MNTHHDKPTVPTGNDEKLSHQLVESLERSLDDIDEHTLLQLRQARAKAIEQPWRKRQMVGGLALAASVTALVIIPMSGNFLNTADEDATARQTASEWDAQLLYLQEDPQMLLDMEMLLAIGERVSEG